MYSDHHLVILTFSLGITNPRERGLWKFNSQLLKSDNFCDAVKSFWPQWQSLKPSFSDPRIWWDADKLQLKEIAIRHSINKATEQET